MTIPFPSELAPGQMRELIAGRPYKLVWRNSRGGYTARVEYAAGAFFLKWGPRNLEESMAGEAERLAWARTRARAGPVRGTPERVALAVPEVVDRGGDEHHEWLLTRALPGVSAVAAPWIWRPELAVAAIGRGLRMFHDAFLVEDCPWTWSVASRVNNAAERGIVVPEPLRAGPAVDRLVVCHGDACCPNTLIGPTGDPVGHVDLGMLGVADRWADIAVAAMSTEWNYGPGWQHALVEAYGVEYDAERMNYYQDLWNAT